MGGCDRQQPHDGQAWLAAGFDEAAAAAWAEEGFGPADAALWSEAFSDPVLARRRRNAGLIDPFTFPMCG